MQASQEALKYLTMVTSGQLSASIVPHHLWPAITTLARQHGLAPLLLHRIQKTGIEPPDIDVSTIRKIARQSATRFAMLELAQVQIENALHEAGIDTIWIKGLALAYTLYPDPATRAMGDLDVLVPHSQREAALAIVQKLGYRFSDSPDKLFSTDDALILKTAYHYHLVGGPSKTTIIELHSRLVSTDDSILSLEGMNWFREQTQTCRTSSITFQTLNPTAHLLYLCAHAEIQHGNFYLLRYLDLHLLVTLTPPDWSSIIQQSVSLRWTYAVESALRTCREWFNTPLPENLLEQLHALRPPDEDTVRIRELKEKGSRWVRARKRLTYLTLSEQLRTIVNVLFPSPMYMRHRYAIPANKSIWPYYLYRWSDQAREIYDALTKQRDSQDRE